VNVGYSLFPAARGKGYASRAVELLLLHLRRDTEHPVATLLIHPENLRSIAVALRLGFVQKGEIQGELFFEYMDAACAGLLRSRSASMATSLLETPFATSICWPS
jgi:RimJ/RimL family protein N-acetyltransferase